MLNAYYSDNTVLNAFYMYISRICRLKLPVNLKIHDVFHIQRLKAATLDEFKGRNRRKMPAIREDFYEVEELLKKRVVRGKEQFLVKWKGFSLGHSSWEPVSNLRCPRLLQQYREEHAGK